jgi:hypothetical protein
LLEMVENTERKMWMRRKWSDGMRVDVAVVEVQVSVPAGNVVLEEGVAHPRWRTGVMLCLE